MDGLGALGAAALLVLLGRSRLAPDGVGPVLTTAGYAVAAALLGLNWRRPWVGLILGGTLLNLSVILANGGHMPVAPGVFPGPAPPPGMPLDPVHVVAGPGTPLASLGDTLSVGGLAASPGDLLMAVGLAGFLQRTMAEPTGISR